MAVYTFACLQVRSNHQQIGHLSHNHRGLCPAKHDPVFFTDNPPVRDRIRWEQVIRDPPFLEALKNC
jgi:hypothetical protein